MIQIPPGHKYATLALHIERLKLQFSDPLQLDANLFATRELPLAMPDHWKTWLGTLRVDELRRANLFLFAHAPSTAPESLNEENKQLAALIHRLYFGLLIAAPYLAHEEGTLMTGVHHNGEVDVREVQPYDRVFLPAGCHGAALDDSLLQEAKRIADGIANLQGTNEHSRAWRIIHAFYAALKSGQFGARLHQFVRCVEGFVLPDIGKTKRQMINRASLFLGAGHGQLVGTLFDVRSAVEHLHDPYSAVTAANASEAELALAEVTYKAEALARHCLQRLFTTAGLWPHFKDDAALRAFWSLGSAQRAAVWGKPMDVSSAFGHYSRRSAAIQLS